MLFRHIARVDFALPLRAYESRVDKDDSTNGGAKLARRDSRSHASHRMPHDHRRGESESFNEPNDIVGKIRIQVSMRRRAGFSVASGVRHDNVVVSFERAYYRSPTSPASDQSMECNERRLIATGSQIMDPDSVRFAGCTGPVRRTAR